MLIFFLVGDMNVKSKIPVRDIMTTKLITISADENLSAAAQIMSKRGIGGILVEKKGEPVGILTEKEADELEKSIARSRQRSRLRMKRIAKEIAE